jgi:hypothetical protein
VVTLSDDVDTRARAVANISAHPAISTGAARDRWLPIAIEAGDQRESRDIHDWLMALEGVEYVDVVSVNFDSQDAEATTPA